MNASEIVTLATQEMVSLAGGSVAVQTVAYMMNDLIVEKGGSLVLFDAFSHLILIEQAANDINLSPDNWTEHGRFSQQTFDENYGEQSLYYSNIGRVIRKLDATFQSAFSIAGAQNYLSEVARVADKLRKQLEDK